MEEKDEKRRTNWRKNSKWILKIALMKLPNTFRQEDTTEFAIMFIRRKDLLQFADLQSWHLDVNANVL